MAKLGYTAGSDSNEAYIHSFSELTTLDDLETMSFGYYRAVGGDPIPPQVDIWLDTDGTYDLETQSGDENWLLGQIPLVGTTGVWFQAQFSDITWIYATPGHEYTSLAEAKASDPSTFSGETNYNEEMYATLGDCPVIAIGIQCGSPASRDDLRTLEQRYYVDDIEINGVVYDFENIGKGPVSISGDARHPIVSISVNPMTIDITKDLVLGEEYDIADVTVTNTGETKVALTAKLEEDDGFFAASLYLSKSGGAIVQVPDWSHTLAKPDGTPPTYKVDLTLDIPRDADPGEHTAVLVFWAEEA